jgi:hypothetical protein
MSFFILGLPAVLVFHVFAQDPTNKRVITLSLVCYLSGVIGLQILGSVRAYHSWKTRDVDLPRAPPMYYEEAQPSSSNEGIKKFLCSCCSGGKDEVPRESTTRVVKRTTPPLPPNTFSFANPLNLIEVLSLTLEFFQMASFSLQNNPYDSTDNKSPTPSPTPTPSGYTEESLVDSIPNFWGKKLFEVLYVHFPLDSDLQLTMMWGAIGLVFLLLVMFSLQFLVELRTYGSLMTNIEDKDQAKDSFFFSFTGSIVYGHGKPNNISSKLRLIVSVLSDALFLIVSIQLLQAISCDYGNGSDDDSYPTLRSDASIRCWEGSHRVLATIALSCYGFYVPLSIMITPMLLEAPKQDMGNGDTVVDPGVSYLKLYLMTINVVKSVMLLVGVLGPQVVVTAVVSSTIASFVLGGVTYLWFQRNNNQQNHFREPDRRTSNASPPMVSLYSASIHPCNIAFINYWKAASYTAAVASSIIVLIAYRLDKDRFPLSALTYSLILTWVLVALVFSVLCYRFYRATDERRHLLAELINYPFYFRSLREGLLQKEVDKEAAAAITPLISHPTVDVSMKHIPGFVQSPWLDSKISRVDLAVDVPDLQGKSLTSELIRYGKMRERQSDETKM